MAEKKDNREPGFRSNLPPAFKRMLKRKDRYHKRTSKLARLIHSKSGLCETKLWKLAQSCALTSRQEDLLGQDRLRSVHLCPQLRFRWRTAHVQTTMHSRWSSYQGWMKSRRLTEEIEDQSKSVTLLYNRENLYKCKDEVTPLQVFTRRIIREFHLGRLRAAEQLRIEQPEQC